MTWSIVAHDPDSGAFAVAVATRSLAVGASCPFVRAGVGAVSTQSMTNRYLGPAVLDGLEAGLDPAEAIERALGRDDGRGLRQVHAVDAQGRAAAFTGRHCVEWCGERTAAHVSVAGNMLAGAAVVADCFDAFAASRGLALPERLMAAMQAGEAAGGDRRGRQSAAMKLVTTEDFPDLDIRVDDHGAPLGELERLLGLWREHFGARKGWAPTRANPSGCTDLDVMEAAWIAAGSDLRFRR
ncbi:DUF1028 domain-containing protein [Phreatobacter sp. AB_2022a]|uniref:DUF1028 domain-containing protein n=1 Tax=Phreatobacter sp. AB_2022a TaxID=3003134 RepID=UPI0022875602|nr:DUF1028 domain-containing protein [Phreatobacter sp. AB_2022a]MCZ0733927.1 DUF1028 domain-containing protein [Phreatobacter sp. AB_2022a]